MESLLLCPDHPSRQPNENVCYTSPNKEEVGLFGPRISVATNDKLLQ